MRYAHWAEISISVAAGLATNTLYDALKVLVERARDRRPVEEDLPRLEDDRGADGSEGVTR